MYRILLLACCSLLYPSIGHNAFSLIPFLKTKYDSNQKWYNCSVGTKYKPLLLLCYYNVYTATSVDLYTYLGCYKDKKTPSMLSDTFMRDESMEIDVCFSFCLKQGKFDYFGLQQGTYDDFRNRVSNLVKMLF